MENGLNMNLIEKTIDAMGGLDNFDDYLRGLSFRQALSLVAASEETGSYVVNDEADYSERGIYIVVDEVNYLIYTTMYPSLDSFKVALQTIKHPDTVYTVYWVGGMKSGSAEFDPGVYFVYYVYGEIETVGLKTNANRWELAGIGEMDDYGMDEMIEESVGSFQFFTSDGDLIEGP